MEAQLETARLECMRDAVITSYQVKTTRWQALQAAAVAVFGVGFVTFLGGSLPLLAFALLTVAVLATLGVSIRLLHLYDEAFERRIHEVLESIGNLKKNAGAVQG